MPLGEGYIISKSRIIAKPNMVRNLNPDARSWPLTSYPLLIRLLVLCLCLSILPFLKPVLGPKILSVR